LVITAQADTRVTLPQLLSAFSLATDLGLGQPSEHVLRSWRIAVELAGPAGLPKAQRDSLFYVAMLAWVGCVADAPEVAAMFGDDIAFRADSFDVDLAGIPGMTFFLGHAGRGGSWADRVHIAGSIAASGGKRVVQGITSHCLSTSTMAEQLGLGADVGTALRQFFSRWDGRGVPSGLGGDQIALVIRLFHVANVVEVHHRVYGVEGALSVVERRRGGHFDPAIADVFLREGTRLLDGLDEATGPDDRLGTDVSLQLPLDDREIDDALTVLADFTDLRCSTRAGHSRGVADLAAAATAALGLAQDDVTTARRAGLLHDIGLHGIPATILGKPSTLTPTEWERVRLSAYYTERVLARPEALRRIGAIAALTHERADGSGYPRGLAGSGIPVAGRVLAAACAFRAMVEPRPHRPPMPSDQAASVLRSEASAGRLDPGAVDAVLIAAGQRGRRSRSATGTAGLTPREVEVLVLIARGRSTKQVASALGISSKTAGTHIEHIYSKTGASSRATATLFALRHGLIDPLSV
jgi:HD-GYP domain-containing protein (c-di-GMP phosphodiesterase class II)